MTCSFWIFVVGAAAAGKSTIARLLVEQLGDCEVTGDLEALNELILWTERLTHPKNGTERARIARLADGGFKILDPSVWDECLARAASKHKAKRRVIFEFARGHAEDYLAYHRLAPDHAYAPSFRELRTILPTDTWMHSVIVHVHAPFSLRRSRNDSRRLQGEHFVNDRVMEEVYREDVFSYVPVGAFHGHLAGDTMPVYSFDNTNGSEPDIAPLLSWLRNHIACISIRNVP